MAAGAGFILTILTFKEAPVAQARGSKDKPFIFKTARGETIKLPGDVRYDPDMDDMIALGEAHDRAAAEPDAARKAELDGKAMLIYLRTARNALPPEHQAEVTSKLKLSDVDNFVQKLNDHMGASLGK